MSIGDGEFGSYGPVLPFFLAFTLSLGKAEKAEGTSKLVVSYEQPGLREDILDAGC